MQIFSEVSSQMGRWEDLFHFFLTTFVTDTTSTKDLKAACIARVRLKLRVFFSRKNNLRADNEI